MSSLSEKLFLSKVVLSLSGERPAEYADRNNMHYTMSVTTEMLRIGIALSTLLHVTTTDVVVRGHNIPKGKHSLNSFHKAIAYVSIDRIACRYG